MVDNYGNLPTIQVQEEKAVRRRRLFIIGALVIALIVVLLAVILILALLLVRSPCQPIDIRPFIDLKEIKPIPSQDYRALVRFAGYLVSKEQNFDSPNDVKYLELKLQKVQVDQHDGSISVGLHTDCMIIDIRMLKVATKHSTKYQFFDLNTRLLESSQFGNCSSIESEIEFETNQYYTCQKEQSIPCLSEQASMSGNIVSGQAKLLETAEIKVLLFELELEGDSRSIREHKFEKDPVSC